MRLVELNLEMEAEFKRFLEELGRQNDVGQWLVEYQGEPFDVLVEKGYTLV